VHAITQRDQPTGWCNAASHGGSQSKPGGNAEGITPQKERKMAQPQTVLDDLIARTTDTGYVVLTTMETILLELAYVEATAPEPDITHLPKTIDDHRFMMRQRAIERAYEMTGR
jgi:hypothetical protein